jgi:hypothetical protein
VVGPEKSTTMADGKRHPNTDWVHKGMHGLWLCNTTTHSEHSLGVNGTGMPRIQFLSTLRDALRSRVMSSTSASRTQTASSPAGAVAIVDLDLVDPPPLASLALSVSRVGASGDLDLVCANGKDVNPMRFWAYDTFATILVPNTFVYPIESRKHARLFPGEDVRFIVQTPKKNQDVFPLFTREDLTLMFDKGPAVFPVRSCFGGFAIYRAATYFDTRCNYVVDAATAAKLNPDER